MDIGEVIRAHRKKCGLTLMEVAKRTRIDHGNLSKIENGKRSLTNETMQVLAEAFGVTLAELFTMPDCAVETNGSIIANKKLTIPPQTNCRPVTAFKRLRDIPGGESVLIRRIKIVPKNEQTEKGWEADEKNQMKFLGDAVKRLNCRPEDLVSMEIIDDAMTPRLYPTDYVSIDTSDKAVPDSGGVFAILIDRRTIQIRRLFPKAGNGLIVVGENDRFPPISLTAAELAHFEIIGRIKSAVVCAGF